MDSILQFLPFQAANGKVVAFRQGQYGVLRTNFGLTISYNWDTHVTIKMPSSYANAVCGLCGNFNGNPRDDLGQVRGEYMDPRNFGKKWQVATRPGCRTDEQLLCPDTQKHSLNHYVEKCKLLTANGIEFKDCWKLPRFNSAYLECAYDSCRMPGQDKPVCDSLATYTSICQDSGFVVRPWRTEKRCREYQECQPGVQVEVCSLKCK